MKLHKICKQVILLKGESMIFNDTYVSHQHLYRSIFLHMKFNDNNPQLPATKSQQSSLQ